jgi:uncharacterized membrane protein
LSYSTGMNYTSQITAPDWSHILENESDIKTVSEKRILGRVLSVILAVLILGGLVALFYSVAVPFKEPFTELYLLGTNGKAEAYPSELMAGEEGRVTVGIVNREYRTATYRLEVRISGNTISSLDDIVLEHGEKWEQAVVFTPDTPGDKTKIEFLLYDTESGEPPQQVYLLVNVK